jgi:hypothetical protein
VEASFPYISPLLRQVADIFAENPFIAPGYYLVIVINIDQASKGDNC